MVKFILKIVVSALAILVTAGVLENGVHVNDLFTSLKVAVALSLLNTFIKPILKILTFPITFITFGLSLLVINTIMVMVADAYITGFEIDTFVWAFAFSLIVSVVTYIMELIVGLD